MKRIKCKDPNHQVVFGYRNPRTHLKEVYTFGSDQWVEVRNDVADFAMEHFGKTLEMGKVNNKVDDKVDSAETSNQEGE